MRASKSGGLSRRTVTRGMAWTVPAVAVATAAPAFATASGSVNLGFLGACKLPGASCEGEVFIKKGYIFKFKITTTLNCSTTLSNFVITTEYPDGSPGPELDYEASPTVENNTILLAGFQSSDSANQGFDVFITFNFTDCDGDLGSGTASFTVPATPPCFECDLPA